MNDISPQDWTPPILEIDGCDTLPKLFRQNCRKFGSAIAIRERDFGIWEEYTWTDYYDRARQAGCALMALGIKPGDVVAIISEDNKEWVFSDLGIQCIGAVVHGLYPTLQENQVAYQLNDSCAKVLFVEDEEQLDKYLVMQDEVPSIEKVIVFDMEGLRRFSHDKVMGWEAFLELAADGGPAMHAAFEARIDAGNGEDIATLIYTSGTTGAPKGAMISHRFFLAQADNHPEMALGPGDEILTFLPLCHAAERIISVATPIRHGITINIAESGETFNADIQEVAPTFIFAVPRVWEKFYSRISFIMNEATAFGRFAYEVALKVAERRAVVLAEGKQVPLSLGLAHRVLDFLVLRNIRVELGLARAHTIVSGAAPISARLLSWFNALGVSVQEAYGQTEVGIVTATVPGQSPIGSIGRAMRGVEVKLAEDGEILIRARSNFSGYLSQPEKTAETMVNGWVHTGDVGKMDDNGDLTILDRKKDIIITAGGKNITPSQLENELKFSPYISDAVIIGDKRKYLTVLIMIDQEPVEKYAQDKRIPFSNYKSLCESEPIIELIGEEVDRANAGFSPVEQVKKFRLIDVLLTAEDEELTPTMKLKRNEVERKYKDLIETMY
ncbi:long-chain fatty acid--CoA ligase [uncultured Roseovarius sp.]|uniref:AMP-dependent synthetase/ligase n=1 Tax=uncultured Roseovarius sp. TaxID=293344 RepID=UPI00262F3110|nr:long-chain fatty acid--CoA ligase [uncultured Roseovarius sp.]